MKDNARVIRVIETTLTRRGSGQEGNPVRIVTQYWSLDGELLAERDSWQYTVTTGTETATR